MRLVLVGEADAHVAADALEVVGHRVPRPVLRSLATTSGASAK